MMIVDAILRAGTEHEVFFLAAAYIETARYCSTLNKLPQRFLHLPLSGIDDVNARFDGLTLELARLLPDEDERWRERIVEALEVLGAALSRLSWLNQTAAEQRRTLDSASLIEVC